jgi:hypothetical protein
MEMWFGLISIMYSECHGYGYTCGFHTGLATGTGTRLPTRQKPLPVPVPVMVMHVAQPNMAVRATRTSSLSPPQVCTHCMINNKANSFFFLQVSSYKGECKLHC